MRYDCALITGASAGLGEEFARQLAGRVRCLVLVARREERLKQLAVELEASGTVVEVVAADLATVEHRIQLADMLAADGCVPDLLVNNAGLGDYGEFASADWHRLEPMLKVNIDALTHLTHLLLPGMIARGGGAVINVSSLASLLPIPDFAVYAATKAYVTSFSEALRIELKPHHVSVMALCPGPVHTEFGRVAQRDNGGREIPGRESFYVSKEQVVCEALAGLHKRKARVFPGWQVAAAAVVISALPIGLIRLAMNARPRRQS